MQHQHCFSYYVLFNFTNDDISEEIYYTNLIFYDVAARKIILNILHYFRFVNNFTRIIFHFTQPLRVTIHLKNDMLL